MLSVDNSIASLNEWIASLVCLLESKSLTFDIRVLMSSSISLPYCDLRFSASLRESIEALKLPSLTSEMATASRASSLYIDDFLFRLLRS